MLEEIVWKIVVGLTLGAPMAWVIYDRNLLKKEVDTIKRDLTIFNSRQQVDDVRITGLEDNSRRTDVKLDKILDITTRIEKDLEYQKGKNN